MNYSELNDLWKKQTEQWKLWNRSLRQQPEFLLKAIERFLQPPDDRWIDIDSKTARRYIEICDTKGFPRPSERCFPDDSFTEDGNLIFCVAFTFDHGTTTYPKTIQFIPVACRFFKQKPEFTLYDMKTNSIEPPWESDILKFCNNLLLKLSEYYSYDPFEGHAEDQIEGQNRHSPIGFIQTQKSPQD